MLLIVGQKDFLLDLAINCFEEFMPCVIIKMRYKMLSSNKKLSPVCILEILKESSDENHPLKQEEIIKKLFSNYGLQLERKSVGATIDSLIDFGFDIIKIKNGCYLGERELENSEISYLIDAVFSSKSIDSAYAQKLAKKLSKFLSEHQRKRYKYIYKSDQIVRTNQKQLFYTIDILNEAIENGKQVEFNYNRFYFDKKDNETKKQKRYTINPYFMINNQGRYYLVCNLDCFDDIANYKVDLISNIKILETPIKPITKLKNCENGVDIAEYANENIYMFHNKSIDATIKILSEYSANYVAEWFGKNAKFYKKGDTVYADIKANEQALIYWCLQYGENIELVSPTETRKEIINKINLIKNNYEGD